MMTLIRRLVPVWALVLFILFPAHALAADYFVNPQSGTDTGFGTSSQPWKTIGKAVGAIRAGDTVHLLPGDYTTQGNIFMREKIGTATAPITFRSELPQQAVIRSVTIRDSAWMVFEDLRIVGPFTFPEAWRDMPEFVVDDPSVGPINTKEEWSTRRAKIEQKYKTYTQIENAFRASFATGLAVQSSDNIVFRNNVVSHHTFGIGLANESNDSTVENNELHHNFVGLYTNEGSHAYSARNAAIKNNYIHHNFAAGIRIVNYAQNSIVENNRLEYQGLGHIDTHTGSSNNIIRKNRMEYAGYYAEVMEHPGTSAISIHTSGPGNIVDSNYMAYQYDITGVDGNGVIYDQTIHETRVFNNIIYRVMGSGITAFLSNNSYAYHNTIVESGYNGPSDDQNGTGFRMNAPVGSNNVITNNIFYKSKNGEIRMNNTLGLHKYVDHNLFFPMSGKPIVINNAQGRYSLVELQGMGLFQNSIQADPGFLDETSFQLNPVSSALNVGTAVYTTNHDYAGTSRPYGLPDLGAYEISSGSLPTLTGDVDQDRDVDLSDLSKLLASFGRSNASADFNGNGKVDLSDLALLLGNFGKRF